MKIKILEMAKSTSKIKSELQDKSAPVFHHLVKYFYIPDEELREHWTKEIYGFLNDIDLLKSTNKFPNADFIIKNTYYIHSDSILLKKDKILNKYKNKFRIRMHLSDQQFLEFCKIYFTKLSEILSQDGYISQEEIKEILSKSLKESL